MAKRERIDDITVRNIAGTQLIFRNFAGEANQYNNSGDRNFCLIIDDELAGELQNLGFTIKRTKARDDYDSVPYIKIKVGFTLKDGSDNPYPPKIYKIDSTGMRALNKNTVKLLDGARILKADLIFSGNAYEDRTTHDLRYSAYVRNLYVEIQENDLEKEYNERFAGMDVQDPNDIPFST